MAYNCESPNANRLRIYSRSHLQEKTGIIKRGDAVYHGAIDPIVDLGAVFVCGGALAFQLVLCLAMVAYIVLYRGVGLSFVEGDGAADGAVHVTGEPVFCQYPRNLRGTFVACDQGCVES